MKILAIDIGTGTQDILLFDSQKTIENSIKMVMPAPTVIASQRIRKATESQMPLAITGVNMGGGPVTQALHRHVKAKLPVYATISAATTFDDIFSMKSVTNVDLRDLDLKMIRDGMSTFGVDTDWDAIAVAVFDHGNAPPGYSDRKFRFDHLRSQVTHGKRNLRSFCYLPEEIPDYMTRMLSVVKVTESDTPILLMDTAEAAVLGALEDRFVAAHENKLVANLGNEHTLAFYLRGEMIHGIFEHHTHILNKPRLESFLEDLVTGDIDNDKVWKDRGHGSIVIGKGQKLEFLSVTGPMRQMLEGSRLQPYFATPHGDMMLAGSFGLIRAWAEKNEDWQEEIMHSLRNPATMTSTDSHPH